MSLEVKPASRRPAASSTTQQRVSSSSTTGTAQTKPPCNIHSQSIISDKATITGTATVSIGAHTVFHPYSRVDSTVAPVQIGQYCILSERTVIGFVEAGQYHGQDLLVELEDNVNVETGAIVQAKRVGQSTIIEANAVIGAGADIGEYCRISSGCSVQAGERISDFTIIYGMNQRRIDSTTKSRADIRDLRAKGQAMHVEALRKLIPSNIAKWQA